MSTKSIFATAAAVFAASSLVTTAQAGVKCSGINSCKGTSACKSASSSCKGQNSCKGQGWTQTTDVITCTTKGGNVVE